MNESLGTVLGGGDTEGVTPWPVYNALNEKYHFTLDVCARKENAKVSNYLSGPHRENVPGNMCACGLCANWGTNICFMNPPYAKGEIEKWIKKAQNSIKSGATVVGLLNLTSSSKWSRDIGALAIWGVYPRIQFLEGHSNPRDSMIVYWQHELYKTAIYGSWTWK